MHPRRPNRPNRPSTRPRLAATLAALAALPLVAACQQDQPAPPPRPTAASLEELKAAFQRTDPSVTIGDVVEVLPSDPFLSVANLPPGSVREGDVVTVVDADTAIVAQGTVARVADGIATVRFAEPMSDASTAGGSTATTRPAAGSSADAMTGPRRPEVGDLVLKYSN